MTMTLDSATVAKMRQSAPEMLAMVDATRARGNPMVHAIHLPNTGEVFISDGLGQPYQKAPGPIRELLTGISCPNPSKLNPLASRRALRDPARKARHDAKVLAMLIEIVEYYSPRLAQHPRADRVFDIIAASVERNRPILEAQPDNCCRWDVIAENAIDLLESLQAAEPGGQSAPHA
ncbi:MULTISPECIES: hypothetical protein [unclassified Methylobacterium]|uniref:hypothetical protein n=1 Tax=unclassified Methylobacterium TaxID=2615210 RepID=UPI00226A411E|nr:MULTISPECIES: hypothetical protein [unclassified Methylobacterium]